MRRILLVAVALLTVATVIAPAGAGERDVAQLITESPNRYTAREVGKPVDLHYLFGPYVIPPGQDSNRITVDIPLNDGFIVAIAPDLVNATTGEIPTQQEAHIHHAHWFRVTNDPEQEYYTSVGGNGLSWVFGTGEEKTQGRLDDRAKFDAWNYGMYVDGETPNSMIYMIHNKLSSAASYYVVLDVTFIPGTREQIRAATGRDIHPLYGQLWGQTKDVVEGNDKIGAEWTVTRDGTAIASGSHLHPGGKAVVVSNLGKKVTADTNGDGKLDPVCRELAVTTPPIVGTPTPGDPDGDGFTGVAILNSYKFDHDMRAWPYTEDYQMGATKYGWRAPVHKGDVLRQDATYAVYGGQGSSSIESQLFNRVSRDGLDHNWYEAMSYTGIYFDREQPPASAAGVCSLEALGSYLLGDDTFEQQGLSSSWLAEGGAVKPELAASVAEIEEDWNLFLPDSPTAHQRALQGMVNHIWVNYEPVCAQPGVPELSAAPPCGPADIQYTVGPATDTITVSGFFYLPGDLTIENPADGKPVLPEVTRGTKLTFINTDAALNVRHTFTSCQWPCVGTYVTNFPLPTGGSGSFDTGKIGNIDPIDGGLTGDDTVPVYTFDTANMAPGPYAYFCRIHPYMRGGFVVTA